MNFFQSVITKNKLTLYCCCLWDDMLLQWILFCVIGYKKIPQLVLVVHRQTTILCCGMLSSLGMFTSV